MKLQTILDHLKASEFSQLNFGAGQGVFDDGEALDKVLSSVSLGLTDLYTRFDLKLGRLVLALQPDQTSYPLTSKHSLFGKAAVDPKYITDTALAPFKDDVLLVKRVCTEAGHELGLNNLGTKYSAVTVGMDKLEIPIEIVNQDSILPECLKTSTLTVHYRANHPGFSSVVDPGRAEIELPMSHITALLYYVASRANNPVGLGQEFNAGNTFAAKYEVECARLKADGMEIQERGSEDKFHDRGFV